MPASFVWQPGPTGGTPTNAANLNRLAVTADIGSAGTPTGDAIAATVAAIGGGKLVPTATKAAAYTAAVGDLAVMNVAGGATTLTLPTAPANKAQVGFLAVGATTATPLTVNRGGTTDTLGPSGATSVTAVLANEVTVYQYDAPNTRWLPVANVKPQTALDGRYALRRFVDVTLAPYNAKGDGTTDDTAAIQAGIDACAAGGTVYLPPGLYKLTAPLTISTQIRLRGEGVFPVFTTMTASSGAVMDAPGAAPWLQGTVLLQTTAATNAINVTGCGVRTDLEGFGIRFADPIRHVNTGHGIYAVPTQNYTANGGTGHDHGLLNASWRDIAVFGHDGNHYAFYALNQMQCRWDHLQSFGGGGVYVECDSWGGNYGNLTCTDTYVDLYCPGTAHGYALKGRATGNQGLLNFLSFNRIQCNAEAPGTRFTEIASSPTTAQYCFTTTTHMLDHLTIIAPDFESWGLHCPTDFTVNGGRVFIDPSGTYGGTNGVNSTDRFMSPMRSAGTKYMKSNLEFTGTETGAPTSYPMQTAAGTTPPSAVGDANNSDERGLVTFGTGTAPTAGQLVKVTWNNFRGSNPVRVMITPNNAATAALGLYVTHDGGGFYVCAANAPAASQANTVYSIEYMVSF